MKNKVERILLVKDDETGYEQDIYINGKWVRREPMPKNWYPTKRIAR